MPAKCRPSARASPSSKSRSTTPPTWAAGPAPLPAEAASSWARRPRPRWSARRSGCRCRTPRSLPPATHLAGCGAALRARAFCACSQLGIGTRDILTDAAVRNAMVLHAAFGGSTNLLLHLPAIAFHAGLRRPTVDDWAEVNREVPRLVDALPNGPRGIRDRAGVSGRRRARSDAAPARGRPAGLQRQDRQRRIARRLPRLVGAVRAPPRPAQDVCATRTASIPTTSSWPRPSALARAHLHGLLSPSAISPRRAR